MRRLVEERKIEKAINTRRAPIKRKVGGGGRVQALRVVEPDGTERRIYSNIEKAEATGDFFHNLFNDADIEK